MGVGVRCLETVRLHDQGFLVTIVYRHMYASSLEERQEICILHFRHNIVAGMARSVHGSVRKVCEGKVSLSLGVLAP